MKLHDCLLGLIILISGASICYVATGYPDQNDGKPGPWLFPVVLSLLLCLCGVILMVRGAREFAAHKLVELDHNITATGMVRVLVLIGAVLIYMPVAEYLGFMITMGVIMAGLMIMMGTRVWLAVVVSAAAVALMYGIFVMMLGVPLPDGELIERLRGD